MYSCLFSSTKPLNYLLNTCFNYLVTNFFFRHTRLSFIHVDANRLNDMFIKYFIKQYKLQKLIVLLLYFNNLTPHVTISKLSQAYNISCLSYLCTLVHRMSRREIMMVNNSLFTPSVIYLGLVFTVLGSNSSSALAVLLLLESSQFI